MYWQEQDIDVGVLLSGLQQWAQLLKHEVTRMMNQGLGMENFAQERVIMACTFTLVKGVCKQAPHLLRNLFEAALQFVWCGA